MDGTTGSVGKPPQTGTHHLGELPQYPGLKGGAGDSGQVGGTHGMQASTENLGDVKPEGKSAIRKAFDKVGEAFSRLGAGLCKPFKALSNAASNISNPFKSKTADESRRSSEVEGSQISSEGSLSRKDSLPEEVYVPNADAYKLGRALKKNETREVVSILVKSEEGRKDLQKICDAQNTPENYKFLETFEKFKAAKGADERAALHTELCALVKPEEVSSSKKYSTGFDDMDKLAQPAALKVDDNVYGLLKKTQAEGTEFRNSLLQTVNFADENEFQAKLKDFEELDEFIITETSQQIRSGMLDEVKGKYKDYMPSSDREELQTALKRDDFKPEQAIEILSRSEAGMQEISSICDKQHMPENYIFMAAVQDFENAKTPFDKFTSCKKLQDLMENGTPNPKTEASDKINDNVYGEIFFNNEKGEALKNELLMSRDVNFFKDEGNYTEMLGKFKQVEGQIKLDVVGQLRVNENLVMNLRRKIT